MSVGLFGRTCIISVFSVLFNDTIKRFLLLSRRAAREVLAFDPFGESLALPSFPKIHRPEQKLWPTTSDVNCPV